MLRKLTVLLLALLLVAGTLALAEPATVDVYVDRYEFNDCSDHMAVRFVGDKVYTLIDATGKALTTAAYTEIDNVRDLPMWQIQVKSADNIHGTGLIDDQGVEVVPPVYARVECLSEKWAVGWKCVEGTEEDCDLKIIFLGADPTKYMKIDTVDIYFSGAMVGTLPRYQYAQGNCTVRGDYLCVRDQNGGHHFYNSKWEPSPWQAKSNQEFVNSEIDGRGVVIHQGSGQVAFSADCTLTPEELQTPYWYLRGAIVDIHGDVVGRPSEEYQEVSDIQGNYVAVRKFVDSEYISGVIDLQGNVVIPCQYKSISVDKMKALAKYGTMVVRDSNDMLGIVDNQGNMLVDCAYSWDDVYDEDNWIYIKNEDKTRTIVGPAGELEEHYQSINNVSSPGAAYLAVTRTDGTDGIIDLSGNVVIPFDADNKDLGINKMGTTAFVKHSDGNRLTIYSFDAPTTDAPAADAPAADDGAWTCENGHEGQTGKFCSECGSPRP